MNTAEVAAQLKTTPKVLRRFLRADPTFRNAGSGGRYNFEKSDLPVLKKRFQAWQEKAASKPRTKAPRRTADVEGNSDVIDARLLRSKDPRVQAEIKRRAEARVDRLEKMLKAKGLHISQMKERESWREIPA